MELDIRSETSVWGTRWRLVEQRCDRYITPRHIVCLFDLNDSEKKSSKSIEIITKKTPVSRKKKAKNNKITRTLRCYKHIQSFLILFGRFSVIFRYF